MSSIKKIQNVGAKINGIIINDLDTSKDITTVIITVFSKLLLS